MRIPIINKMSDFVIKLIYHFEFYMDGSSYQRYLSRKIIQHELYELQNYSYFIPFIF